NEVSTQTYFIMFLNVLMFFIGYIVTSYKKKNYKINNDIIFGKDIEKLLLITQIIIFPILLFYVVKYQRLLDELGHTYARLIKYDLGLLFSSVFESALYSYILQPLLTIISILVAIKFVQGKIRNITFILMFINLILNTQIG